MKKRKYQGPRRRRVPWPPQQQAEKILPNGDRHRADGEPIVLQLKRWPNDKSVHASHRITCCDCGLEHLCVYQAFERDGEWYLVNRAYRVRDGKPPRRRP